MEDPKSTCGLAVPETPPPSYSSSVNSEFPKDSLRQPIFTHIPYSQTVQVHGPDISSPTNPVQHSGTFDHPQPTIYYNVEAMPEGGTLAEPVQRKRRSATIVLCLACLMFLGVVRLMLRLNIQKK